MLSGWCDKIPGLLYFKLDNILKSTSFFFTYSPEVSLVAEEPGLDGALGPVVDGVAHSVHGDGVVSGRNKKKTWKLKYTK